MIGKIKRSSRRRFLERLQSSVIKIIVVAVVAVVDELVSSKETKKKKIQWCIIIIQECRWNNKTTTLSSANFAEFRMIVLYCIVWIFETPENIVN